MINSSPIRSTVPAPSYPPSSAGNALGGSEVGRNAAVSSTSAASVVVGPTTRRESGTGVR